MADTGDQCNELSGFMKGRIFVHEVHNYNLPKKTMLHEVKPLIVHSQYGQADRLTQSLLIHFHTMNSCFSVNLYKNTQKKDLSSGNFVCLQFVWGEIAAHLMLSVEQMWSPNSCTEQ